MAVAAVALQLSGFNFNFLPEVTDQPLSVQSNTRTLQVSFMIIADAEFDTPINQKLIFPADCVFRYF
jgi:hypothetical protein